MSRFIPLNTMTAADLAGSDENKADFAVVMTAGMTPTGDVLFFERWRKRGAETLEIVEQFLQQMRKYRCYRGLIEKNRYESLMKTARKLARLGHFGDPGDSIRMLARITMIPHYVDSKDTRLIDNLQPMINGGHVWLPDTWDEVRRIIASYPAVSHDDDLDVMEMIVSNINSPRMTSEDLIKQSIGEGRGRLTTTSAPINPYTGLPKHGNEGNSRQRQGVARFSARRNFG